MNIKALIKSLLLRRFNSSLLLLQLALTLGLIVNSVILSLDVREKLLRPTGLDLDNTLVLEVMPTDPAFNDPDYYVSVQDQDYKALSELDGVELVSGHVQLPLQRGGWNGSFTLDGADPNDPIPEELQFVAYYLAPANGAESFGLKLLEGRYLNDDDTVRMDQVMGVGGDVTLNIVISEALAKTVFGDKSPIGQLSSQGRIVGVVSNMVNRPHLADDEQYYSFSAVRMTIPSMPLLYTLRIESGKMAQVRAQVEEVLLSANPNRDLRGVYLLAERHADYFKRDTGLASLFTMLAVLMLVVTAISSFAHAQYHISRQKKLIGIRRALGARKRDVLLYVLAENWLVTALGAVLGIIAVVGFNVILSEQVEISKPDVVLYGLAVLVVFVAGAIATWLPAWQTSRIPPVIATRTV